MAKNMNVFPYFTELYTAHAECKLHLFFYKIMMLPLQEATMTEAAGTFYMQ